MLDYASDIGQHNGGGHGWEPSRAGVHHTYNIRVCVAYVTAKQIQIHV